MIKNIVFDMGKVLVDYDAMPVCEQYIEDWQDRQRVCTTVFVSPEWVLLDMGVIPEEDAVAKMCSRVPERLHDAVRQCMAHWHEYNMQSVAEMEPLILELKDRGFGVYLCSNASMRLLECYQSLIPAIDRFDGVLFSAEVECMKPQKEMYEHLFERFSLKPEECYFIDDLQLNIDGAKVCGMDGYCFADRDVSRLRQVLEAFPDPMSGK